MKIFKQIICKLMKHQLEIIGKEKDQDGREWTLHKCKRCGKGFKAAYRVLPHPITCSLIDVEKWSG